MPAGALQQHSRVVRWARAGQGKVGRCRSCPQHGAGGGRAEHRAAAVSWGNAQRAGSMVWEVNGLVVVSLLLLTAVPWGSEENSIAGTEG